MNETSIPVNQFIAANMVVFPNNLLFFIFIFHVKNGFGMLWMGSDRFNQDQF